MSNRLHLFEKIFIRWRERVDTIRRAFREFLTVPSLIILGFLIMAGSVYILERSQYRFSSPLQTFLKAHVFADAQATSDLLGTIAGSIITVTSITITLLLLIVQQTASNMSSQVFDQFLRRRSNQLYFGFFVGLAVYTLITLATVDEPFNPVFAASLAFFLTVIALFLLIVLFYSTIHQMRPPVIIAAIYDHTLSARSKQKELIQRTRRFSQFEARQGHPVRSKHHGFVTDIHLNLLEEAIQSMTGICEIVIRVSIGEFVAFQDLLAEVKTDHSEDFEALENKIRQSVHLEPSRDLEHDPAYGIKQLEIIAWTVTSTAKSNLAPGLQTIYSLRDLLARWADEDPLPASNDPLSVVYNDEVIPLLISTFESLAVVAAESKEHQITAEIFFSFSRLYDRLLEPWQQMVVNALRRLLPTIRFHVLTRQLEEAILEMIQVLQRANQEVVASLLRDEMTHLQLSEIRGKR